MTEEIYIDNSATTRPYDEVTEYMNEINRKMYGNPSSMHTKGIEAEKLIKKSRETIADTLMVKSKEIVFTSGGTESNNLAIRGYLNANSRRGRHIITTKIEHPSVLEVFKHLEEKGYKVEYLEVDKNGTVNLERLKLLINNDTALISVAFVNNETGTIQPLEEISRIRNFINKKTIIHVDAVQAYGKIRTYPGSIGVEMMSLSSHKIHGPKGTGALYIDSSVKVNPIMFGGGQESLLRSGTENVPGICGFGLAAGMTFKSMDYNFEKVKSLNKLLAVGLNEIEGAVRIVSPEDSSPYILNAAFACIKAEVLLHHLEEKGIFVSAGSACSSRRKRQSHVLTAMGLTASEIEGAIRFSFSAQNKEDDIIKTIEAIKEILPKIRIKHGGRK